MSTDLSCLLFVLTVCAIGFLWSLMPGENDDF